VQVNIVNPNHLAAEHVNDLLVKQIAFQEKKAFGLRRRPIG
jgi:hypothetical protein